MTLNEALATVHPWLGTWKRERCPQSGKPLFVGWVRRLGNHHCQRCNIRHPEFSGDKEPDHDIPMPPATDELAMGVLRKIESERIGYWELSWFNQYQFRFEDSFDLPPTEADDPRDAIIIAAATWVQSQEKQKE